MSSYRTAFALVALVVTFAAAQGCGGTQLPSPEAAQAELIAQAKLRGCQAKALAPLLGDVERAQAFISAVRKGEASVPGMLAQVGATAEQVYALEAELRACQIAHAGVAE